MGTVLDNPASGRQPVRQARERATRAGSSSRRSTALRQRRLKIPAGR
jgi:hypothetical protein